MKRLFFVGLFILITLFSFSAEVIRYVDPDSAVGGNGTTWALAYDSLFDWEAAEQTDLPTDGDWHHVYCRASSGTADTTALIIAGWTTDTTHYIFIEAASGDEALKDDWDTARYRLSVDGTAYHNQENYVRVKGLQIENSNATSTNRAVLASMWATQTSDIRILNCRIRHANSSGIVVEAYDSDATVTFVNTIMSDGSYVRLLDGTFYLYNCVIYDMGSYGISLTGTGTATIINCAVFNNPNDFDIGGDATGTINYTASDDGDGTNAVSPSGSDWDNEYTDPANGDFTLLNTGNCYHGGASAPDSDLYTTDMEGDTYNSAAYSIGVDEYVSAGGSIAVLRRRIMGYSAVFNFTNLLLLLNTISGLLLTHTMMKLRQAQRQLQWYSKPENIKNLAIVEKYLEETHA